MQETQVRSLEDPIEQGMATHSCIPAWRNPMDRGAQQATYSPWGLKELDTTERRTLHTYLHSNTTFNLADELFNITYNQPKEFESTTSKITFSELTEIFQNKGHQRVMFRVDPLSHIIPHHTAPNLLRFPVYADIIYLPGKNESTDLPQVHTFQLIIMGWNNLKLKNFFPLPHFFLKVIMSKQMRVLPVQGPSNRTYRPKNGFSQFSALGVMGHKSG